MEADAAGPLNTASSAWSFGAAVVLVLGLGLGWWLMNVVNNLWLRPRRVEKLLREQGLGGNPYRLFFGDLKDIKKMREASTSQAMSSLSNDIVPRVLPDVHRAVTDYGKKCFLWFGARPAVIITDPEAVKEIFSKSFNYPKPPRNPRIKVLTRGVATYEGDKWAKHRKLITPAFHLEKLKHMVPSFHLSCADMLSLWEKIIPDNGSRELDVWPYIQTMTSDAISRTAFGSSYEEGRRVFELQKVQAAYVMEALRSVYIPGMRFLPTKSNRRMEQIVKEVETTLLRVIKKRMQAIEAGESSGQDLLGLLLESNFREIKEQGHKHGMSLQEVIEECKLFYFAGQDTTATLLTWTMVLLSKHPAWQSRAREEVRQVLGGRQNLEHQDLNQLKVMTMIFYEVLRLYPSIPLFHRITCRDSTLGGLQIPSGVQLLVAAPLLHRDKEIWGDDVLEFNPERFSEGVSKATNAQAIYIPFGAGPRLCIGQNFAMLEAKMAMSMILQGYTFELSPSYSHAPQIVISLVPQHGAHLILHKNSSSASASA
ncbi:cytochrome P450 CYP72A219-like [Andrographis paniculata]|uniref:cytochrome P450 CYP72A219-like n=1 Tax=Andrographis paniculata TaxID=175694 RepID=UPI0021E721D6|nr:cytochrome P450 CYP72A219-like [Andrographis paniculata]